MYSIRTTPGFIIDSRPFGEAGRTIIIFSRDLGLVSARAQGIRLEKSKLRYHTREFSLGTFSLVKGKEFWRLTSAASLNGRAPDSIGDSDMRAEMEEDDLERKQIITRVAFLLRRLLHGEEPHLELFDCVHSCVQFLNSPIRLNDEQILTLESLIVVRVLRHLGYIGLVEVNKVHVPYLDSNVFSIEVLDELKKDRVEINSHINKALRESQL